MRETSEATRIASIMRCVLVKSSFVLLASCRLDAAAEFMGGVGVLRLFLLASLRGVGRPQGNVGPLQGAVPLQIHTQYISSVINNSIISQGVSSVGSAEKCSQQ